MGKSHYGYSGRRRAGFAAADRRVMDDAPRDASAFIITSSMKRSIFVTGILSAAGLLGVLWWFYHTQGGVSRAELSMFFTLFVMMQVWNLMNVKAFASGRSAFAGIGQSDVRTGTSCHCGGAGADSHLRRRCIPYRGSFYGTVDMGTRRFVRSSVGGEAVRLFTGKKTVKKYKA